MNLWQTLTSKIFLEDGRDLAARIGVRFIFCTFPYFVIALIMNAVGDGGLLNFWVAPFLLAVPIIGGMIDWYRLHHRTKAGRARSAGPISES
ncbi:hypothetical protein [Rubinisphaera sp. JC750]|uniref:hypothetical protein n=1 Tax=Rubinisphaera sp. JC750 TaxID=2898658 RepID=UPI001F4552A2|nr:hypothetical protein [Rubinisphaera sp. JC750]